MMGRFVLLSVLFFAGAGLAAAAVFSAFGRTAHAISLTSGGPEGSKDNPETMKTASPEYSKAGYNVKHLSKAEIDKLALTLSKEDADVILARGTERAFCGNLLDNHKDGVYVCKLCGLPLFASNAKFNSGTGWPSFFQPFDKDHITEIVDKSYGMTRTEIECARCGGHLGHVFDDGPAPTGLRYCLNSASLTFYEKGEELPAASKPIQVQTAYFAGGCFWGVEDRFQQVPGVIDAVSGYMGGKVKDPTYKLVCSEETGHAETVKVTFDPAKVSYKELLAWFFKLHDPSQLNRQGPDYGTQYRSAIFAATPEELAEAKAFIAEQQGTKRFEGRKIVTQVESVEQAGQFYAAEEYHQDYHLKHGGSCPMPEK
ncbi:MAG: bifunctional methionine sulfoxide reductase B/A protein [Phycisphaerales bacterium]|jgi:peptide methionine sulfoxide reductase msrA/msrB